MTMIRVDRMINVNKAIDNYAQAFKLQDETVSMLNYMLKVVDEFNTSVEYKQHLSEAVDYVKNNIDTLTNLTSPWQMQG